MTRTIVLGAAVVCAALTVSWALTPGPTTGSCRIDGGTVTITVHQLPTVHQVGTHRITTWAVDQTERCVWR